jgi:hypothetical protein
MRTEGFNLKARVAYCSILIFAAGSSLRATAGFDGTEFSGGRITGPILTMCEWSIFAFLAAIVATFLWPRIAAAIGLLGAALNVPFLCYTIAPGPFRTVFHGEYSVPLKSNFEVHATSFQAAVAVLIVASFSAWILSHRDFSRQTSITG